MDNIVIVRPTLKTGKPQNLCFDSGCTGCKELVEERDYTACISPKGEEKKELETNPDSHVRR